MRRTTILLFVTLLILSASWQTATGQVNEWGNRGEGDWFTAANWSSGVPTSAFSQRGFPSVNNGGTAVIANGDALASNLQLGWGGGKGYVRQDSGTLNCTVLYAGAEINSYGQYNLNGGALTFNVMNVGYGGNGLFCQSGGTVANNTISTVYIGRNTGSNGTLQLSGGSFGPNAVFVGQSGAGLFQQSGGVNAAGLTTVTATGRYELTGGAWGPSASLLLDGGVLDFASSNVALDFGGGLIDFSRGSVINSASASITFQANSLLILAPGFDPSANFGGFTSSGIVHYPGSPIAIQAGRNISACGRIDDHVETHSPFGTVSGQLNLNGGLTVRDGATVGLGTGQLIVNDDISGMDSGQLTAPTVLVGSPGTGRFCQTGGAALFSTLYLGKTAGADGTYEISGSAQLNLSGGLSCGNAGNARFIQSGGSVTAANTISIGYQSGSTAQYALSGGLLVDNGVNVSSSTAGVNGSFLQTGGTHQATGDINVLGNYTLQDGALNAGNILISRYTPGGGFFQNGGIITATWVYVGSGGQYKMTAGSLTTGTLGASAFVQSGGTVQVNGTGGLQLGAYTLSGDGSLDANTAYYSTFSQAGGQAAFGTIKSNNQSSTYSLTGGSLTVRDVMVMGKLDCGASAVTIAAGDNSWVDFSTASIFNAGQASFSAGHDSFVLVKSGVDLATVFGTFTTDGIVHQLGTPLVVPAGRCVTGYSGLSDHVQCAGTIVARAGQGFNLSNGLEVLSGGSVNLGTGTLTVNDTTSGISGGSLTAATETILKSFTHSAGSNAAGSATCEGTYNLSGAGQLTVTTNMALNGGTISQSAGSVAVGGEFSLNNQSSSGAAGSYLLTGGAVNANSIYLYGKSGIAFDHNGGDVVCGTLKLCGITAEPSVEYRLRSGNLTVGTISMFGVPSAVMRQSGGTCTATSLTMGDQAIDRTGRYELSAGQFQASTEYIGTSGTGYFKQTGGQHDVQYAAIGAGSTLEYTGGAFNLNGGLSVKGKLELGNAPVVIDCPAGGIFVFSANSVSNAANATMSLGDHALVCVSSGYDVAGQFGHFTNAGLTHVLGTPLSVPSDREVDGWGTIDDPVVCQGSIRAGTGGFINMTNGLNMSGGRVDLGSGTLTIKDAISGITAGQISAGQIAVGNSSVAGTFTQSGGSVRADSITRSSSYILSGGDLSVGNATIGGKMAQSGDSTANIGTLTLQSSMSSLLYRISGGSVTVGNLWFQNYGKLSIESSAAQVSVTGGLHTSKTYSNVFSVVPGSAIHMMGASFDYQSSRFTDCMAELSMIFESDTGAPCTFEVAGGDGGPSMSGFSANAELAGLAVGGSAAPGNVKLVDKVSNSGAGEVLYVKNLRVTAGSTLDLNNVKLYYLVADIEPGATISGGTAIGVAYLSGDATLDGKVSFEDYIILANNFGQTGNLTCTEGDFNGDGRVSFADYILLANNFGQSVPEPATLGLLALGGLGLIRRRRK